MCGIAGVFQVPDASATLALMMRSMQHRGPQAAGIASVNGHGRMFVRKGPGSVDTVFGGKSFKDELPGTSAVGHLHYSTSGAHRSPDNIHPFTMTHGASQLAFVHNGNITNHQTLTKEREAAGAYFHTWNDTELFPNLVAAERALDPGAAFSELLVRACKRLQGAYATLALGPDRLLAITDPHGFRPLTMGRYEGGFVFASESCALDLIGATDRQEIPPGTICEISSSGVTSRRFEEASFSRHCAFEHIYFSHPSSVVFGATSGITRNQLGKLLANKLPVEPLTASVLTPIPDSSNAMAVACAEALGIPFRCALIRSHTVGRTFLAPDQLAREFGLRMKLSVVADEVRGKRVVVVDDSLVRSNTIRKVVKLLRGAGAKEIHVAIASPPVIHPCFWGIDTPTKEELVAANMTVTQIQKAIEADSLTYLTVADLREALHDKPGNRYCTTCFTGEAPVPGHIVPVARLRTHTD